LPVNPALGRRPIFRFDPLHFDSEVYDLAFESRTFTNESVELLYRQAARTQLILRLAVIDQKESCCRDGGEPEGSTGSQQEPAGYPK
jgi:hypothetical protein